MNNLQDYANVFDWVKPCTSQVPSPLGNFSTNDGVLTVRNPDL
jgi:hypothetical protein